MLCSLKSYVSQWSVVLHRTQVIEICVQIDRTHILIMSRRKKTYSIAEQITSLQAMLLSHDFVSSYVLGRNPNALSVRIFIDYACHASPMKS